MPEKHFLSIGDKIEVKYKDGSIEIYRIWGHSVNKAYGMTDKISQDKDFKRLAEKNNIQFFFKKHRENVISSKLLNS